MTLFPYVWLQNIRKFFERRKDTKAFNRARAKINWNNIDRILCSSATQAALEEAVGSFEMSSLFANFFYIDPFVPFGHVIILYTDGERTTL